MKKLLAAACVLVVLMATAQAQHLLGPDSVPLDHRSSACRRLPAPTQAGSGVAVTTVGPVVATFGFRAATRSRLVPATAGSPPLDADTSRLGMGK